MRKIGIIALFVCVLFAGAAFAQAGSASAGKVVKEQRVDAKVLFRVLDMKHSKFGIGKKLSRVTVKLVSIDLGAWEKDNPLAADFLRDNAAEIDLSLEYKSTGAFGGIMGGDWTQGQVDDFVAAYKKNHNTQFSGYVRLIVLVGSNGGARVKVAKLESAKTK
jgi:hypothetical protein